jgi:hypothetical protein
MQIQAQVFTYPSGNIGQLFKFPESCWLYLDPIVIGYLIYLTFSLI